MRLGFVHGLLSGILVVLLAIIGLRLVGARPRPPAASPPAAQVRAAESAPPASPAPTPTAEPTATAAPSAMSPAAPAASPAPPSPTPLGLGMPVPRPTPEPGALAAGAPLRGTLLAQIDEYERASQRLCPTLTMPTPSGTVAPFRGCSRALQEVARQHAEFGGYAQWFATVVQCYSNGRGGYIFGLVVLTPTPDQLRDPALLDLYVSGSPWCRPGAESTPSPGR